MKKNILLIYLFFLIPSLKCANLEKPKEVKKFINFLKEYVTEYFDHNDLPQQVSTMLVTLAEDYSGFRLEDLVRTCLHALNDKNHSLDEILNQILKNSSENKKASQGQPPYMRSNKFLPLSCPAPLPSKQQMALTQALTRPETNGRRVLVEETQRDLSSFIDWSIKHGFYEGLLSILENSDIAHPRFLEGLDLVAQHLRGIDAYGARIDALIVFYRNAS